MQARLSYDLGRRNWLALGGGAGSIGNGGSGSEVVDKRPLEERQRVSGRCPLAREISRALLVTLCAGQPTRRVQNAYISPATRGFRTSKAGRLNSANCRSFWPASTLKNPPFPAPNHPRKAGVEGSNPSV